MFLKAMAEDRLSGTVGAYLSPEEKVLFDEIAKRSGEKASWIAAQLLRRWMITFENDSAEVPVRKGALEKPLDMRSFEKRVRARLDREALAVGPPAEHRPRGTPSGERSGRRGT
jgi:transposase-like protein